MADLFLCFGSFCFDVWEFGSFSGGGRTMCAPTGGRCIQCPPHMINQSVGNGLSPAQEPPSAVGLRNAPAGAVTVPRPRPSVSSKKHMNQTSGTVKTVPYRTFYNWRQTSKHPVGRGHPTTPHPRHTTHKKSTTRRAPPVGRDAPIPPRRNLAIYNKRCKNFVGDDARHRPARRALPYLPPPKLVPLFPRSHFFILL